jgi:hypothetical protein
MARLSRPKSALAGAHAKSFRRTTSTGLPMMRPTEKPQVLPSPPQTPMRYPGGKSRTRKQIIETMPPHATYVEPFAGSGSVLLAKPPVAKEVLSDKNKAVMQVHRGLKHRAEVWDMSPSRKRWERIKSTSPQSTVRQGSSLLHRSLLGGGRVRTIRVQGSRERWTRVSCTSARKMY